MKWLYLAIDCLTLVCPIIVELIAPTGYIKRTKAILISITVSSIPFIIWDSYFTTRDIWSFNPDYSGYLSVAGGAIAGLPIEEILFFFAIPYATLYIYHLVKQRYSNLEKEKSNEPLVHSLNCHDNDYQNKSTIRITIKTALFATLVLLLLSPLLALLPTYTGYVLSFFIFLLLIAQIPIPLLTYNRRTRNLHHPWLRAFVITYLIHLIPFFIVNGILTALPVVIYNPTAILGFRLGTIPIEDLVYSASLLLLNITILESSS